MFRHRILPALLLAAATSLPTHATTVDDARAKGLKWLVQAQKGDGSFSGAQGLDTQATAGAVEAMIAGGMTRSPQFARALSWLANAPGASLDSRAWQAMALAAAGRDATGVAGAIRDERDVITAMNGSLSGGVAVWGPFPGYTASSADTALGYGALRSAGVTYANDTNELTSTVLCKTLGAQLTASPWVGAWPYALPQTYQPGANATGSLLATALTLYELKKERQANRFLSGSACSRTSPSAIDTAMTAAKTWLIAQANTDGGFAERSAQGGALEASNPLATALAIRALTLFAAEGDSAATTAVNNARNWLAGQQAMDGSWRGDPFVTARVLSALPTAAGVQIADADGDGLPDVVEQLLGTQTATADSQNALANNAAATSGITAPAFAVSGTVGQAFAYALTASGGTGPYTFGLVNGALPPGLTLAVDGQITGTPTGSGSYAFDYQATDSLGTKTSVIGRIDIAEAVAAGGDGDGDVPIPGWALIALAASMIVAIRRNPA